MILSWRLEEFGAGHRDSGKAACALRNERLAMVETKPARELK
jgi:hypothetical protein